MSQTTTTRAGYRCKQCDGTSPVGVGYVDDRPGGAAASAAVIRCACGQSETATAWAVLNCFVTQVLGTYSTEAAAAAAAAEFGSCSFPYRLSDAERAALIAA